MCAYVCVSLTFQLFICAFHASLSSFFLPLSVTLNIVNVLISFYLQSFSSHMHSEDPRNSQLVTGKSIRATLAYKSYLVKYVMITITKPIHFMRL